MPAQPKILTEVALREAVGIDDQSLQAVESAFGWLMEDRVNMPPIMHIAAAGKGDVDVKSAFVDGLPYFAIKIASGFHGNRELGLPVGSAMMVLLNAQTGFCDAVLFDNSYLTDLRTGMAGAIAARYLAPDKVRTVGVLGTGTQARYQVQCLRLVRDFDEVVVWGRAAERAQQCAADLRACGENKVAVAASVEELARASDVLITVTASDTALIQADWLRPGQHITAVGADFPGKQELDAQVLRRADLVACDVIAQCVANGELQHVAEDGRLPPAMRVIELGELTTGRKQGRTSAAQITVCDLTGTGVQDTAIANLAYAAAGNQRISKTSDSARTS